MGGAGDTRPDTTPGGAAAGAIAALRARGAARLDPVRWAHIEALARRAAAHDGATRQVLDDRLGVLLARCGDAVDRAHRPTLAPSAGPGPGPFPGRSPGQSPGQSPSLFPGPWPDPPTNPAPLRGPLARLMDHVQRAANGTDTPATPAPPELKAIRDFAGTWSRLRVDQRLTQSRTAVPGNAGPLNTQRLLHEALSAMRDVSPEYLHHVMSHVEALLWLDRASLPSGPLRRESGKGTGPKKSGGTRSGPTQ